MNRILMRKIILASQSKARRQILAQMGLKVKVVKPHLKEDMHLKGGCAALVMRNALRKAQAAARQFKTGIVIGADTVVLVDKKVIGKPKHRADAFKTLKLLSQRPQWVYSGIAVIDLDKQKTYQAFDKTKVYMHSLSDDQINSYINNVDVHRLAGSFDIQGRGARLVKRIEGCYYNVVGLPLAKLAVILKKL